MRKTSNVIIFIPTLARGGAEKIASELSLSLSKYYNVTLLLFRKEISYKYKGKLISLDAPNIPFLELLFIYLKLLLYKDLLKNSVVITFDEKASLLSLLVAPHNTIITIHKSLLMADKIKDPLTKFLSSLARKLYNKAFKVIAVSEGIKEELKKYVKEEKIEVIHNPFRIEEIRQKSSEKPQIPLPQPYILNIGRLEYQKGQWHLIRAFKKVREKKDIKLVIIGSGRLKEKLEKLISRLNLQNDIILITEWIENVYPMMKNAELFVLSSISEGFVSVLVEAVILNVPFVSTNCKHSPKEIAGNCKPKNDFLICERGILIPPLDGKWRWEENLTKEEEILANAIIYALEHKNELMKQFVYEPFLKKVDEKNVIKKYVSIIKKLDNWLKNHQ